MERVKLLSGEDKAIAKHKKARASAIVQIKKLRALSKSPNEHEALRATERANDMMVKYGIWIADLGEKPVPPVGYFAWVRSMRATPWPEKFHEWRMTNTMPETKKMYESTTVGGPFPLTAAEWELSLNELAKLYPYQPKLEKNDCTRTVRLGV